MDSRAATETQPGVEPHLLVRVLMLTHTRPTTTSMIPTHCRGFVRHTSTPEFTHQRATGGRRISRRGAGGADRGQRSLRSRRHRRLRRKRRDDFGGTLGRPVSRLAPFPTLELSRKSLHPPDHREQVSKANTGIPPARRPRTPLRPARLPCLPLCHGSTDDMTTELGCYTKGARVSARLAPVTSPTG